MFRYYLLLLLSVFPSGFLKDVDAANCSQTNDLWKCKSGACIKIQQLCDGTKHCRDGSDETKKSCKDMKCSSLSFRCKYGACIPVVQVCDGVPDCVDSSDEDINYCRQQRDNLPDYEVDDETSRRSCVGWGQMKCWSGQCVNIRDKCNGIRDCDDGSDETEVLCGAIPCTMEQFRCGYGACIPSAAKCNGTIECVDGTDELENLCKGDDATEAAITVTTTTFSTMTTITPFDNEISNVADTNSSDLFIPLGNNNIDENYISESSTKIMSTTPAQQGKNILNNNKNVNSSNDGVIEDNTDDKTTPKYDNNNEVTIYTNVDHMTRKPGITVEQSYRHATSENAISLPSVMDYSKLQNVRPTTLSIVKAADIKPIRPLLKINSTQPGLDVAVESSQTTANLQPIPVSKHVVSNTTAKPSRPSNDFILKTSLLEENTTSKVNLIRPINPRDEVLPITQSTPTTNTIRKIVPNKNKAINQPNIYKFQGPQTEGFLNSTSQMPPTFNQAHSVLRTQVTTTTAKVQRTDVAKSTCTLRGCEYPLNCALAMPPGNSINKYGRTILEVGSEVKFSCADGHVIDGVDRNRCTATGWSHDTPSCLPYCEVDFIGACRPPLICYYKQPGNDKMIKINHSFYEKTVKVHSSMSFSCDVDYQLEGTQSRECKMNGWQGEIPRCVNYCQIKGFHNCNSPIKCKIMDSNTGHLRDYTPHFISHWLYKVREDSFVDFSCESGYELIGMNRSTCGNYGWDNDEPSCEEIPNPCDASIFNNCPHPLKCKKYYSERTSFLSVNWNSKPDLEHIEFSCAEGYVLNGDKFLTCTRTRLNNVIPQCVERSCRGDKLPNCASSLKCVAQGPSTQSSGEEITANYSLETYPLYTQVIFSCPKDYELQGSDRTVCGANGWSHAENNDYPQCRKITYTKPISKSLHYCKGNLIPKCEKPLECTLHHSALNSDQKITNRSRPKYLWYPEGSQVTYSCSDGYKLRGENRTICGANGWSHEERMSSPKCYICDNQIFERCKHPVTCHYHNTRQWIYNIQGTYLESMVPVGSTIDIINRETYREEGYTRFQCTAKGWVM